MVASTRQACGWSGTLAASRPSDPAQLEVVVPADLQAAARSDTTVHQDQLTPPPADPCWVRCFSISSPARLLSVEGDPTRGPTEGGRTVDRLAGGCVSARAQVLLRDQRRNCDHTRVHGPNDSGRYRHWQPVCIASTTLPEVRCVLGSALAGRVEHTVPEASLLVVQITGVRHAK